MPTLTLLAHVSTELHAHTDTVSFILLGLAMGALCICFRKTA